MKMVIVEMVTNQFLFFENRYGSRGLARESEYFFVIFVK